MGRANNSSVDTKKGDKLAKRINSVRNTIKAGFEPEGLDKKEQIINAKKAAKPGSKPWAKPSAKPGAKTGAKAGTKTRSRQG